MKTIEKIRQKIEELYNGEAPKHDQQCDFSDGYFTGLSVISNFLDTLSEEPDKSLNTVADYARRQAEELLSVIKKYNDYSEEQIEELRTHLMAMFLEGTVWQKSQMLKDAVEGEVMTNGFYPYEPRIVAPYPNCPYTFGDKVRIVVLKAEEE